MSLISLLLGRLANREAEGRKIGVFEGVPAMGLDGLGSASCGPEAMLTVLAVTGGAGLDAVQPITWAILALLAILFLSYWQAIAAYPSSGGSCMVARENLGHDAGLLLLAATALMVDYMLNVAVGISAGVGALTSAVPVLHPYTLPLYLSVLCLSANTSFVDFPRLCRQVAADGYLPKAFALPGRRLAYAVGVLFLAAGTGVLLVAFRGITDRADPAVRGGGFRAMPENG